MVGSPAYGCGHNKFLLEVIKLALANLINRSWKFARLIAMFHYEKRELSIHRILILFFSRTLNELELGFFSSAIIQFNEGKSRIWLAVGWGGVRSTISSQGGTHEAELGQPLNCAKLSQEENSSLLTTVRAQRSTTESQKESMIVLRGFPSLLVLDWIHIHGAHTPWVDEKLNVLIHCF